MNYRLYRILLGISILGGLGGLLTLLPWPWATYPNILGYRSLCTFAPGATFFCFAIAGTTCIIRANFVKKRQRPPLGSLLVVGTVLVLALGSTVWFSQVKARYTKPATTVTGQPLPSDTTDGTSSTEGTSDGVNTTDGTTAASP